MSATVTPQNHSDGTMNPEEGELRPVSGSIWSERSYRWYSIFQLREQIIKYRTAYDEDPRRFARSLFSRIQRLLKSWWTPGQTCRLLIVMNFCRRR